MLIVNLLLGLGITIAVLYGVYRLHRSFSGGATRGDLLNAGIRRSRGERTVELERFIADFRAQQSPALARQHIDATTDPSLGIDLRHPAPAAALEGPARLIFLLLKTALPDHHILPKARVEDFVRDAPSAVAALRIDFLVCDRALAPVSAVCIAVEDEPVPGQAGVAALMREVGLRYVALNLRALPRRGDVRDLVLGHGVRHNDDAAA